MASVEVSREGHRRTRVQAHRRQASDLLWERIEGRLHGTAERRETKRSGKGHGESECSHSTREAGEPNRGTPWREGEHRDTDRWRERSWEHRFPIRSLRNSNG